MKKKPVTLSLCNDVLCDNNLMYKCTRYYNINNFIEPSEKIYSENLDVLKYMIL